MFLYVSVILFTGGSASVHAGIPPPGSRHPPGSRPPLEQTPPREQTPQEQCMLGDTGNKRAVSILLECILVICIGVGVGPSKHTIILVGYSKLVLILFTNTNTRIQTIPQKITSLPPDKRSFGQGNVFTPVCQSFCSQGGVSGSGSRVCTPPWTPPTHTPPWRHPHPQAIAFLKTLSFMKRWPK